jgi:hypothetical protein
MSTPAARASEILNCLLVISLLFLALCAPALSRTLVIEDDPGGLVPLYIASFQGAAKTGVSIRLRGECASACTMILKFFPRSRVCAEPGARLGFHQPLDEKGRSLLTAKVRAFYRLVYPSPVAAWLNQFRPTSTMRWRPASDFFKQCGA